MFRTGNVVKLAQGSLVIISGYRRVESKTRPNTKELNYQVCDYVYVDHENTSSCSKLVTNVKTEKCSCDMAHGETMEDCEDCDGTGSYEHTDHGMDNATLIATNVKSWIIDTLTNKFNF